MGGTFQSRISRTKPYKCHPIILQCSVVGPEDPSDSLITEDGSVLWGRGQTGIRERALEGSLAKGQAGRFAHISYHVQSQAHMRLAAVSPLEVLPCG